MNFKNLQLFLLFAISCILLIPENSFAIRVARPPEKHEELSPALKSLQEEVAALKDQLDESKETQSESQKELEEKYNQRMQDLQDQIAKEKTTAEPKTAQPTPGPEAETTPTEETTAEPKTAQPTPGPEAGPEAETTPTTESVPEAQKEKKETAEIPPGITMKVKPNEAKAPTAEQMGLSPEQAKLFEEAAKTPEAKPTTPTATPATPTLPSTPSATPTTLSAPQKLTTHTTLPAGSTFPTPLTLPNGTVVPANTPLPSDITVPAGTILPQGTKIPAGKTTKTASTTLTSDKTITSHTTLPTGTTLPQDLTLPNGTVIPANTPLTQNVTLPAGSTIPAGTSIPTTTGTGLTTPTIGATDLGNLGGQTNFSNLGGMTQGGDLGTLGSGNLGTIGGGTQMATFGQIQPTQPTQQAHHSESSYAGSGLDEKARLKAVLKGVSKLTTAEARIDKLCEVIGLNVNEEKQNLLPNVFNMMKAIDTGEVAVKFSDTPIFLFKAENKDTVDNALDFVDAVVEIKQRLVAGPTPILRTVDPYGENKTASRNILAKYFYLLYATNKKFKDFPKVAGTNDLARINNFMNELKRANLYNFDGALQKAENTQDLKTKLLRYNDMADNITNQYAQTKENINISYRLTIGAVTPTYHGPKYVLTNLVSDLLKLKKGGFTGKSPIDKSTDPQVKTLYSQTIQKTVDALRDSIVATTSDFQALVNLSKELSGGFDFTARFSEVKGTSDVVKRIDLLQQLISDFDLQESDKNFTDYTNQLLKYIYGLKKTTIGTSDIDKAYATNKDVLTLYETLLNECISKFEKTSAANLTIFKNLQSLIKALAGGMVNFENELKQAKSIKDLKTRLEELEKLTIQLITLMQQDEKNNISRAENFLNYIAGLKYATIGSSDIDKASKTDPEISTIFNNIATQLVNAFKNVSALNTTSSYQKLSKHAEEEPTTPTVGPDIPTPEEKPEDAPADVEFEKEIIAANQDTNIETRIPKLSQIINAPNISELSEAHAKDLLTVLVSTFEAVEKENEPERDKLQEAFVPVLSKAYKIKEVDTVDTQKEIKTMYDRISKEEGEEKKEEAEKKAEETIMKAMQAAEADTNPTTRLEKIAGLTKLPGMTEIDEATAKNLLQLLADTEKLLMADKDKITPQIVEYMEQVVKTLDQIPELQKVGQTTIQEIYKNLQAEVQYEEKEGAEKKAEETIMKEMQAAEADTNPTTRLEKIAGLTKLPGITGIEESVAKNLLQLLVDTEKLLVADKDQINEQVVKYMEEIVQTLDQIPELKKIGQSTIQQIYKNLQAEAQYEEKEVAVKKAEQTIMQEMRSAESDTNPVTRLEKIAALIKLPGIVEIEEPVAKNLLQLLVDTEKLLMADKDKINEQIVKYMEEVVQTLDQIPELQKVGQSTIQQIYKNLQAEAQYEEKEAAEKKAEVSIEREIEAANSDPNPTTRLQKIASLFSMPGITGIEEAVAKNLLQLLVNTENLLLADKDQINEQVVVNMEKIVQTLDQIPELKKIGQTTINKIYQGLQQEVQYEEKREAAAHGSATPSR